MVDIGAGHVTGVINVIESNQIDRWIIGLEINGDVERIPVTEGTVGIDGNLGNIIIDEELCCSGIIAVDDAFIWISITSREDRTELTRLSQGAHPKHQGEK